MNDNLQPDRSGPQGAGSPTPPASPAPADVLLDGVPFGVRERLIALSPLALALMLALSGCAGTLNGPPPATAAVATPAAWHAPLPHGGDVTDLARWWTQFDDPLLPQLIAAAEAASPTLASATSRIE